MKVDCAHKLESYKGICSRLHGHTYNIFVLVNKGKELKEGNMIIDFKELKETSWLRVLHDKIESKFDHQYLNEVLGTNDPTAEFMAKKIYDEFIRGQYDGLMVMVMETESSVVIYDGENFFMSASKK